MHHLVIYGPEPVETQALFIPIDSWFHLFVRLVSNNMVNFLKSDRVQKVVESFLQVMRNESW